MAAIGDSEGTVTIMQLCKALYETTNKEKEVMGTIFDREFRREKNLLTQKKLNKDASGKDKKAKDMTKLQAEKESIMKETIKKIEEDFFDSVADDANDKQVIKARGEMNQEDAAQQD